MLLRLINILVRLEERKPKTAAKMKTDAKPTFVVNRVSPLPFSSGRSGRKRTYREWSKHNAIKNTQCSASTVQLQQGGTDTNTEQTQQLARSTAPLYWSVTLLFIAANPKPESRTDDKSGILLTWLHLSQWAQRSHDSQSASDQLEAGTGKSFSTTAPSFILLTMKERRQQVGLFRILLLC